MITFEILDRHYMHRDALGVIPYFFDEADPRPAREQINERYVFGGWQPFEGFVHRQNLCIKYPGDPLYVPVATARLREETIAFYRHSWLAIFQPDGSFEVARVD